MDSKSATLPSSSASSWIDQLPVDPQLIKRTIWTECTPLPPRLGERFALQVLHDHEAIIKMHPNMLRFRRTQAPPNCVASEQNAIWYEITERVQYLPNICGTHGEVTYKVCFQTSAKGLYTHVFAPAGVDIVLNWAVVDANQQKSEHQPDLPHNPERAPGWCLMEDADLRCNIFLFAFTKRNLRKSHADLAAKMIARAQLLQEQASGLLVETSRAQPSYSSTGDSSRAASSAASASVTPLSSNTTPEIGENGWTKLTAT